MLTNDDLFHTRTPQARIWREIHSLPDDARLYKPYDNEPVRFTGASITHASTIAADGGLHILNERVHGRNINPHPGRRPPLPYDDFLDALEIPEKVLA